MTTFSIFTQPTSALRANSLAFNVIGDNISNAATPGYKAADTRFREQIIKTDSGSFASFGGVKPNIQHFVDKQGIITATNQPLDVAIQGKGFFVTNAASDSSDEFQFTRAGEFGITVVDPGPTESAFLTDIRGNFVHGWPSDGAGGFTTGTDFSSLVPIQIDSNATPFLAVATTTADIRAILPADSTVGDSFDTAISVFDDNGTQNAMSLTFTKTGINAWDLDIEVANSDLTTGVFPTTPVTFSAAGILTSASTVSVTPTFTTAGAGTTTVTFDIADLNEFSGAFTVLTQSSNGNVGGELQSLSVTDDGVIEGVFSNGLSRSLYKLPLATVVSPNLLDLRANTHYAISLGSGAVTLFEADLTEQGRFLGKSLETSTTSIENEFAKMIINQQAYSSNVRAYTVAEEMIRTATDLKQ
jgi:flagellar hook protein FlgE